MLGPKNKPTALERQVRAIVSTIEEERYHCDMSGLDPSVVDAAIRSLRPDQKLGICQKVMLRILHRYGPKGMEHGRRDLEQFVSRLLRVMDEETDISPQRDMTPLQQEYFQQGEALELTRRRVWPVLTGACGAGFLASGSIDLLAGKEPRSAAPAEKPIDPWTRRIREVQREKDMLIPAPVEAGIGAVILNDGIKEWDRVRVELLTEKLKDVAAMVDKLAIEIDQLSAQQKAKADRTR